MTWPAPARNLASCRSRPSTQKESLRDAKASNIPLLRDLTPFIGSRNRFYEVLNRKRPLTLKMIRRLHSGLGTPAESLIKMGEGRAT